MKSLVYIAILVACGASAREETVWESRPEISITAGLDTSTEAGYIDYIATCLLVSLTIAPQSEEDWSHLIRYPEELIRKGSEMNSNQDLGYNFSDIVWAAESDTITFGSDRLVSEGSTYEVITEPIVVFEVETAIGHGEEENSFYQKIAVIRPGGHSRAEVVLEETRKFNSSEVIVKVSWLDHSYIGKILEIEQVAGGDATR